MKIITLLMAFVLAVSVVSAFGVSYPQPQNIELKPSEASYFTFQIQTDDFGVTCVPSVDESSELELAFNQKYEIEANQRYNIKPQVIAPKQTSLGSHKTTFCMECTPTGEVSGSKIVPRVCNLPISVNVVSERTRDNLLDPTAQLNWVILVTILTLLIVIMIVVVIVISKKRKVTVQVTSKNLR